MEPRVEQRQRLYPIPTTVMMGLALVFALGLVDWTGNGVAKPIWMFAVPILCGAAGSLLALAKGAYGWATASAVLGLSLLPVLIILTTLISGP
ncbi:hypothetical protein OK351_06330 [Glutamicibacter sp. MNS18]|uniref:hypothetical protein n=1 Tax=Glutamicibacter sp. MNS18 TaxID=2989817 RepID=UPI002235457B|nr:hypothetical protein [Glutamicibacter sp. MNS18]MCW4465118.1 hypothetical protein [Glutamicibacter sp. MNS18]